MFQVGVRGLGVLPADWAGQQLLAAPVLLRPRQQRLHLHTRLGEALSQEPETVYNSEEKALVGAFFANLRFKLLCKASVWSWDIVGICWDTDDDALQLHKSQILLNGFVQNWESDISQRRCQY